MTRTLNAPLAALLATALLSLASAASPDDDLRPHAGMLRYPDVSRTHVVFSYANDLWLVPRTGGTAVPLASPPGQETFPRFSPDGQTIAFVGNYDGNKDLYTISVTGGLPTRVTHHPTTEVLCDFTRDGRLLYFASGFAGLGRQTQLFTVAADGGLPVKLPPPYGANGAQSEDGRFLAYTPHTRDNRTWKRYRGGMATDIWLFDTRDSSARKITDWEGTDTLPMWHGSYIYYLSDAGPVPRLNVWRYDTRSGSNEPVTRFTQFDCKWPAMGPGPSGQGEIVFQNGSALYLLDLGTGSAAPIDVTVPGDRPQIRPKSVDVSKNIGGWSLSSTGKRAAVEARGDIWTLPAENGSPRNLTRTSGVYERDPSWSPDGRWIAYFSDATGEYELNVTQSDGKGETKRLTTDGSAFRYSPRWSPDSKRIAFTDKSASLFVHAIESGETKLVDKDPWGGGLGRGGSSPSWSHDNRFLAYAKNAEHRPVSAIWIYEIETGERRQATSGMFSDQNPTFDRKGDWLFYTSNRNFNPFYADVDTTFIYANSEVLLAAPLRAEVKSPWAPKSDEETWKDDDKKKDGEGDEKKKDDGDATGDASKDGDEPADENDEGKKPAESKPDDGVSGTWEGTLTGPAPLPPGGVPLTITLVLGDGNSLSGSATSPMGTGTITSGTYDPATKAISATISAPTGETLTVAATVSGTTMTGTVTMAAAGLSMEFTVTRTSASSSETEAAAKGGASEKPREKVEIEFEGFELRAIALPVAAGSFGNLAVNDQNDLLYARRSFRGSSDSPSIKSFSLKNNDKKEEKNVASGSGSFDISADGKKILVVTGSSASIQNASAGASGKPVSTSGLTAIVDPREEWKQIFTEAWRLQRDYFYDPNMHGVDWKGMRERYTRMIEDCNSREDVSYVIGELISELNVGHAYVMGGGDTEGEPQTSVGLLGADYSLENGAYRISRIYGGAPWDSDARGPLSQPGVVVRQGDYLLEVNGTPLDTRRDPWAAFQGLSGKVTSITVSEKPEKDDTAREILVEPIGNESTLRYRDWIEQNRQYVEKKTGGRVGYIYVPDTGVNGQNDLIRQFVGQAGKDALIVDERWNGGGQIPTRFIEMLKRPATNYWARRDGKPWLWPPDSHQGPKCMLINGLAGSGGDAFPAYFRQAGLGKLVGISGNPRLIDGGYTSVPTFAYYELDGTWGIEGHGVDPDIEVVDHPALMVSGGDPQLDAGIDLMMREIQENPFRPVPVPPYPDRSGMGIRPEDK